MNDEIKFEDIKFPFGLSKDFMQKEGANFIINSKEGGDFFPNRNLKIMEITAIFCCLGIFFLGCIICIHSNNEDNVQYINFIFTYLIFMAILFPYWYLSSLIKTTFTFSSNGIDIHSKKGSLFIPKEDIETFEIAVEPKSDSSGNTIYYYYIFLNLKKDIYIPYTKEYKNSLKLFNEYYFKSTLELEDDINIYKMFLSYLIQEMKKALDLNKVSLKKN